MGWRELKNGLKLVVGLPKIPAVHVRCHGEKCRCLQRKVDQCLFTELFASLKNLRNSAVFDRLSIVFLYVTPEGKHRRLNCRICRFTALLPVRLCRYCRLSTVVFSIKRQDMFQ